METISPSVNLVAAADLSDKLVEQINALYKVLMPKATQDFTHLGLLQKVLWNGGEVFTRYHDDDLVGIVFVNFDVDAHMGIWRHIRNFMIHPNHQEDGAVAQEITRAIIETYKEDGMVDRIACFERHMQFTGQPNLLEEKFKFTHAGNTFYLDLK